MRSRPCTRAQTPCPTSLVGWVLGKTCGSHWCPTIIVLGHQVWTCPYSGWRPRKSAKCLQSGQHTVRVLTKIRMATAGELVPWRHFHDFLVFTSPLMHLRINHHRKFRVNPFTPESDQCQNSPAASQEIWHHTVWRTWLFIAYSDERWLYYQFSLHHSYNRFLKGWENTLFELRSERVKVIDWVDDIETYVEIPRCVSLIELSCCPAKSSDKKANTGDRSQRSDYPDALLIIQHDNGLQGTFQFHFRRRESSKWCVPSNGFRCCGGRRVHTHRPNEVKTAQW